MHLALALGFLTFAILCFVGAYFEFKRDVFSSAKDQASCTTSALCGSDASCCALWDGSNCRKGKFQGENCESNADLIPLFLVIFGIVSVVVSIYFFFKHHKAPAAHYYF